MIEPRPKFLEHPLTRPVLALLFASVLGVALVTVRVVATHRLQHLYLVGNLLLAWIPLIATVLLDRWDAISSTSRSRKVAAIVVWFFFFPNAPYILTDLVHLRPEQHGHYWVDMVLILLFGLTGLVLAFLSLLSMQHRVERRLNRLSGWLFVAVMSLLSGIGIYAGRFLRWNSWDVVARPWLIVGDIKELIVTPSYWVFSIVFPLVFALFLFTFYLTLWAVASSSRLTDSRYST